MVAYMNAAPYPDPVGGVADGLAAVVALRELADRLEDAEVERALRDGWSWTQIADALGVTRQAVHKKHLRRVAAAGIELRRRNV
ncbi:helix-turn-helix domain-containing protein [Leifsonia sp. F6_8S_P_1A]|uniref:Helix-turn-helix domain-containing protein n=2 Tax=Microbacteriaceae TaxID=85023 RepID=A0ABT8IS18_9MICO|nr:MULTISPECIES: helix-turn-helix domain-containing protein [Leifsonia]MDN4595555.1 helix-turn-helix domain-containing protein [Leifsonia virtsii]